MWVIKQHVHTGNCDFPRPVSNTVTQALFGIIIIGFCVEAGSVACQVRALVGLAIVYMRWKPVKMSLIGELANSRKTFTGIT